MKKYLFVFFLPVIFSRAFSQEKTFLNGFRDNYLVSLTRSDNISYISANSLNVLNRTKQKNTYDPKDGLGVIAGWGTPYGWGIEYSHLAENNRSDINTGIGISLSGMRIGVGTRYYLKPDGSNPYSGSSPYLGANLVYATGLSRLNVSVNDVTGVYKIPSDLALFVRGGYKIKYYKKLFLITIGYGIPILNNKVKYLSGSNSSNVKKFAQMQALGGLEISAMMIFRIEKQDSK